MAASQWMDDTDLKDDLSKYVAQNLKRAEILDFVKEEYPDYPWSMPTLDRRLRYFGIQYIDYKAPLETVKEAVAKELKGPGKCLGYRALNHKLRTEHNIKVPRHLVYNVLSEMDPEGLEERSVQKKAKRKKQPFTSEGPLWLASLDGHDKLCGYQNWTFPLGIYGCLDTFSRKILFLFVCTSNSNPLVIGKQYLNYIYEEKMMPRYLRIDKGTETGKMATLHACLIEKVGAMDDPVDSVIYGPSTTNKIERWWRDLHERLEKFFKQQLTSLLQGKEYDPFNQLHRQILAYVYIPVVQREADIFVKNWNSHRIRQQAKLSLPTGVPNHMFSFPEKYGATKNAIHIARQELQDVAENSGLLEYDPEIMLPRLEKECKELLPDPQNLDCNKVKDAYIFLKNNLQNFSWE